VVQGISNILQWWRDRRLKFSTFGDLARKTFWVMATSAANERVFGVAGQCLTCLVDVS